MENEFVIKRVRVVVDATLNGHDTTVLEPFDKGGAEAVAKDTEMGQSAISAWQASQTRRHIMEAADTVQDFLAGLRALEDMAEEALQLSDSWRQKALDAYHKANAGNAIIGDLMHTQAKEWEAIANKYRTQHVAYLKAISIIKNQKA